MAITSGEGKNRNVAKNPNTKTGGLSYSYRLEFLPMGKFDTKKSEYVEGGVGREASPKLAIAAAYNFNDDAVRSQGQLGSYLLDDETRDVHTFFVDYIFKYKGFSSMGEFAMKNVDNPITVDPEVAGSSVYIYKGMGYVFQTSYLFDNNVELAARYAHAEPHADIAHLTNPQTDLTVGISKYIVGHKLKVQADMSHSTIGTKQSLLGRFQVEVQF